MALDGSQLFNTASEKDFALSCNLFLRLPFFSFPVTFRNISFVYFAVLTSSLFLPSANEVAGRLWFSLVYLLTGGITLPLQDQTPLEPDPRAGRNMDLESQKRAVRILLECFLVSTCFLFTNLFCETSMLFNSCYKLYPMNQWPLHDCRFQCALIVVDNMARPPFSCKEENSMTFRIDENVLDSGTGFPGMLTFFCNGQKGMYKVGRKCKASIFPVITFDHLHFTAKICW